MLGHITLPLPMKLDALRTYLNHITPIPPDVWEDFAQQCQVTTKAKGELLLREGQVCDFVSFINQGMVRVYELVDGVEVNRAFFMTDFFATEYQSFLTQEPSEESLEAIETTELVTFSYTHLQTMFARYKSFERLGRLLAEDLYLRQRKKVQRLLIQSPEERYLLMLKENPDYLDKIPHYHVASYLGIKPQSLSRIRKRLK